MNSPHSAGDAFANKLRAIGVRLTAEDVDGFRAAASIVQGSVGDVDAKSEADSADSLRAMAANNSRTNFTIAETIRAANISRSKLYRDVRSGKIRVVRFGKSVRIPRDELNRILSTGY
jgi:excisionase family DNA binding protein